jgi:hypothetical protein
MHYVNTPSHSQILHIFQFAGEMSNIHMHIYSPYSYNMIAHSMRKIHISENREKTVQRLIYQGFNYLYGSKIMGSYF